MKDDSGMYQCVCPKCGCFASHTIYDDDESHDYWKCNYCTASGFFNPWREIPKDNRQAAWDAAQVDVDIKRGLIPSGRTYICIENVNEKEL